MTVKDAINTSAGIKTPQIENDSIDFLFRVCFVFTISCSRNQPETRNPKLAKELFFRFLILPVSPGGEKHAQQGDAIGDAHTDNDTQSSVHNEILVI